MICPKYHHFEIWHITHISNAQFLMWSVATILDRMFVRFVLGSCIQHISNNVLLTVVGS